MKKRMQRYRQRQQTRIMAIYISIPTHNLFGIQNAAKPKIYIPTEKIKGKEKVIIALKSKQLR